MENGLTLPFFEMRKDGLTAHPSRYKELPKQIIIGYAEDLNDEDQQLFIDITKKHRKNIEVLLYSGLQDNDRIIAALNRFNLPRVEGAL